jgi:hypothetical protein
MSGVPAVPAGMSTCRSAIKLGLVVAVACCTGAGSSIAANTSTTLEALASAITPSAVDIQHNDRAACAAARAREPRGTPRRTPANGESDGL